MRKRRPLLKFLTYPAFHLSSPTSRVIGLPLLGSLHRYVRFSDGILSCGIPHFCRICSVQKGHIPVVVTSR
jgi:hypothetical protein